MLEVYWGCLIIGVLMAIVTVIFGDILSQALGGALDFLSGEPLHVFQPMVILSALTVFGGAGIMLESYTELQGSGIVFLSLLCAVVLSAVVYFFYVRPMHNAENSVGFSMQELVGTIGEVYVPIPADGFGEVVVKRGGGLSNQIAASFDAVEIEAGERVVIIEVKDHTLYVACLDNRD